MQSHITCLADHFLKKKGEMSTHILPVEGGCPKCKEPLIWGDVIRHKHGCYQNLTEVSETQTTLLWSSFIDIFKMYFLCRGVVVYKLLHNMYTVFCCVGLDVRKAVLGGLRTTKAQTSLRICAV